MNHRMMSIALIPALTLFFSACQSRRKRAAAESAVITSLTQTPRAESMGRFNCDAYSPTKSYEAAGRAKPQSDGPATRFEAERAAQLDALRQLFSEAAGKCRLSSNPAKNTMAENLRIESSRVLSETPDGTVNVKVTVSGRDILEQLEIAAQGGYGEPAPK